MAATEPAGTGSRSRDYEMKYLKQWARKIYLLFFRLDEQPALRKRKKKTSDENVIFGQFTTIKTVLDSLDELFADMKLIRPKSHNQFQRLLKRYGPYVCSLARADDAGDSILGAGLDAGFKAYGLPSFLINYRDKKWYKWVDDTPVSEFFIATKQASFPYLKPKNNDTCYECCFVGMLNNKPLELNFNIVIDGGGNVTAYPYLARIPRTIKGRVVSRRMGLYYPDLENVKELCNIERRKKHLVELFCINYNMVLQREASINIIVKKGSDRATITVPPNRWKYFFKDREKIITNSGRQKPIFHAVASHHRHHATGKISPVKTHYRGLRSFRWGEYSIKIVLPGKHSVAQSSFGLSGKLVSDEEFKSGDYVDLSSKAAADKLNKLFEGDQ
jgi:hypothetical protein